jgi:hypothetical protein
VPRTSPEKWNDLWNGSLRIFCPFQWNERWNDVAQNMPQTFTDLAVPLERYCKERRHFSSRSVPLHTFRYRAGTISLDYLKIIGGETRTIMEKSFQISANHFQYQ